MLLQQCCPRGRLTFFMKNVRQKVLMSFHAPFNQISLKRQKDLESSTFPFKKYSSHFWYKSKFMLTTDSFGKTQIIVKKIKIIHNSTTPKTITLMYLLPFFFFFFIEYICVCFMWSLNIFYILHILLNIMLWTLYVVCMFSHVSKSLCIIVVFVLSVILSCLFLFWCHLCLFI